MSSADESSNAAMSSPPSQQTSSEALPSPGTGIPTIITTETTDTAPNSQQCEDLDQADTGAPLSDNDWQSTPQSKTTLRSRSPGRTGTSRGSPRTSNSLRPESESESELLTSSSTGSFSGDEDALSSPENLVFGTAGVETDRKEVIEESNDELVENRSTLAPSPLNRRKQAPAADQAVRAARAAFSRIDGPLPNIRHRFRPRLSEEHSEITDFGGELHYKDRKSRRRKTKRSKSSGGRSLQDRLFEALEPIDDKTKDKGFFPIDLLPLLITKKSVSEELNRHVGQIYEPDEIEKFAQEICSEKRVDSFESGVKSRNAIKPRIKTYRKIFATLVLIEKTPAIMKFMREGVNDSDLPLVRSQTGYGMRRSRAQDKDLKCFQSGWTPFQIRNFEDWQWTTLAPFFAMSEERKEVRHYPLQDRVILPFLFDSKRDEVDQELLGGGGRVFKAMIHPDHHNFHGFFKCPRALTSDDVDEPPKCTCLFAIKCLHSQDKESFKKEVDMLKRFSNNAHTHLISLLATYEQKRTFFLIFPRAEADLQAYWKKTPPPTPMDTDTVCWVAQQCLGIAKGVVKIHEYESSSSRLHPLNTERPVGNHGDIKPENVLWFRDDGTGHSSGRGTLKLSDFGLADLSARQTASRQFHSRVAVTCNYRAPECDLPNQGGKGRQYDMWTLGCLYLEFVTWLVGGSKLLEEFTRARLSVDITWYDMMTDTFFKLEKDAETGKPYAIVKPSVTNFIKRLRSDQRCTPFIRDFLDLIQTGLLVVKNPNPRIKDRLSIEEAHAKLNKMVNRCTDWNYTCKSCNSPKGQMAGSSV